MDGLRRLIDHGEKHGKFGAYDGLHSMLPASLNELGHAGQRVLIGQCQARHLLLNRHRRQCGRRGKAFVSTIVTVDVQMNERHDRSNANWELDDPAPEWHRSKSLDANSIREEKKGTGSAAMKLKAV